MKTYEVAVHIEVNKSLFVEAESEDDAMDIAFDICDKTVIPVTKEDEPDIFIEDVIECPEEISRETLER